MDNFFKGFFLKLFKINTALAARMIDGGGAASGNPADLINPLVKFKTLFDLLDKITELVTVVLLPFSTLMGLYAGWLFMTAGGNETKIKTAQRTLRYVVIGTAVIILSKAIVPLLKSILEIGA